MSVTLHSYQYSILISLQLCVITIFYGCRAMLWFRSGLLDDIISLKSSRLMSMRRRIICQSSSQIPILSCHTLGVSSSPNSGAETASPKKKIASIVKGQVSVLLVVQIAPVVSVSKLLSHVRVKGLLELLILT